MIGFFGMRFVVVILQDNGCNHYNKWGMLPGDLYAEIHYHWNPKGNRCPTE